MRVERDHGKMTPPRLRLYHSMYQLFSATMLVALTTNNMGILWVAMEAATLTTVLLVSVYRTAASLEAAWKYFILRGRHRAGPAGNGAAAHGGGAGLGPHGGGLLWTSLAEVKQGPEHHHAGLRLPVHRLRHQGGPGALHNWLPDAHAEGPTPVSAVLSGLLLNVALYAVLRCKVLTDGALQSALASQLMIAFGLLSVVVAAFFLSRQKDVMRAYSSIEHMGLITFAFGLGGSVASYAGLLHMTVHSLIKSAIFYAVGHACQKAGTQVMEDIRGLIKVSPTVAWGLMLGALAILGMPPFGVFASEFLILTTAMREQPWATPFLLPARWLSPPCVQVLPMVFGETSVKPLAHSPALLPVFVHLGLGLMLGLYVPPYLDLWYRQAARMLGADVMQAPTPLAAARQGALLGAARWSTTDSWQLKRRRARCRWPATAAWQAAVALAGAAVPGAARGGQRRLRAGGRPGVAGTAAAADDRRTPTWPRCFRRPAGEAPPTCRACAPWGGRHPALVEPRRLARRLLPPAASGRVRAGLRRSPRLPLRARRRRRRARNRRRPGACRHHRAGPLPLFRGRRKGAAAGGAAGLHPQGHGAALHPTAAAGGLSPGGAGLRRFHGGLCLGLLHGAGIGRRVRDPQRAQWLRALLLERERVANHLGDLGALGNDAGFGVALAQFSRLRKTGSACRRCSATAS